MQRFASPAVMNSPRSSREATSLHGAVWQAEHELPRTPLEGETREPDYPGRDPAYTVRRRRVLLRRAVCRWRTWHGLADRPARPAVAIDGFIHACPASPDSNSGSTLSLAKARRHLVS